MGFIVKAVKSVVKTVVGVVSKVVGAVFGFSVGNKTSAKTKSKNTLNKSLEPEAAKTIMFGRIACPLDLRFWEVWGANGSRYDEVMASAGHRINAYLELYMEDALAIDAAGNVQDKFAGVLSREYRLGANNQTAISVGSGTQWTDKATFDGVAHLKLAWIPDEKKLPNGIPSRYTQVCEGALVYDPRRDSTVPGGFGSHRVNDRETWSYAALDGNGVPIGRNNALQALWYLLGWVVPTKDKDGNVNGNMLVLGRGIDPEDINLSSFIAGANACEAAGYYTDMVLSSEDTHTANEDKITCSGLIGRLIDPGGLWSYYANVDDTANIAVELTDADIIQGVSVNWNEFEGMAAQFNQVSGKFINPSPTTLFQAFPYPMVRDATYEANLGVKRRKPQDFEQVLDGVLAQRLARLLLNQGQYQGEFSAGFNYRALKAQAWSIVRYTSERFGFVKLFRVYRHDVSTDAGVGMLLKEVHSSIWGAGSVTPPLAPGLGINYQANQEIPLTGLYCANAVVQSNAVNATIYDAGAVAWDEPPVTVRRTEVRYKVAGSTYWETVAPVLRGTNQAFIFPLVKTTAYEVQARHVSINEVEGPWKTLVPNFVSGALGNIDYQGIINAGTTAQWPYVGDPDGKRPEDNATYGAPGDSPVGSSTGNGIVTIIVGQAGLISQQRTDIDKLFDDVQYLFENGTGGEGGVVAQAVRDAQAARDAAQLAASQALSARNLASDYAQNSKGFADASAGSASNAEAKANDAGQFASSANASAVQANTSKGAAEASQSKAAVSESNALGSQNSAAIQASLSAKSADRSGQAVINRHFNFADGQSGGWPIYNEIYMFKPRDHGQSIPPNGEWVYHVRAVRDTLEQPAIPGVWDGRTLEVSAVASTEFSDFEAGFGVFVLNKEGAVIQYALAKNLAPRVVGYKNLVGQVKIVEGAASIVPWIWINVTNADDVLRAQVRVQSFYIRDASEKASAAASAQASNDSASTAATKATEAGNSASASNDAKLAAEAANVRSNTSATNSYNSAVASDQSRAASETARDLSATYRDQSGGYRDQASNFAGNASSSAALADASRASASNFVEIAARVATPSINRNPSFSEWPDGQAMPTGWADWSGGWINTRIAGQVGRYSYRQYTNANPADERGMYQVLPVNPNTYYVVEADVTLAGGVLYGAGVHTNGYNSADVNLPNCATFLNFGTNTKVPAGAGIVGNRYLFSQLIKTVPNMTIIRLYLMSMWGGFAPYGEKHIDWHSCRLRAASEAEIVALEANTSATNLSASVDRAEQAAADANRAAAQVQINLDSRAGALDSSVGILGQSVADLKSGASAARLRLRAVAGGNVAEVDILSDNNSGGVVRITGTTEFAGKLRIGLGQGGPRAEITDSYTMYTNGSVMTVSGLPFGSNNQFMEWVGPYKASLNQCTEADAIRYINTNGFAYFGGGLNAGVITNPVQTSSLNSNAEVSTGVFGSNGKTRVVSVSYQMNATEVVYGGCPNPTPTQAIIQLFRGTGEYITEFTVNGQFRCIPGGENNETGRITESMNGSITFTDNTGGSTASFLARLIYRQTNIVPQTQILSIISVEQ